MKARKNMYDLLMIIGFVVVWYFLQAVILPKMGVNTWMSNACSTEDRWTSETKQIEDNKSIESKDSPAQNKSEY